MESDIVERFVWAVGSKVDFGEHRSKKATISQVMIRKEGVGYEIYWWEGTMRHEQIVLDDEIPDPEDGHRIKVKAITN